MGGGATSGNIRDWDATSGTPWSSKAPIAMGNRFKTSPIDFGSPKQELVAQPVSEYEQNMTPEQKEVERSLDALKNFYQNTEPGIPKMHFAPDGRVEFSYPKFGRDVSARMVNRLGTGELVQEGDDLYTDVGDQELVETPLPFKLDKIGNSLKNADPKFSGLDYVLQELEGPEIFDEGSGKKSRWGIGVGASEGILPNTLEEAKTAYLKNYADPTYDSLKDEYDRAVFANLKLHRPAWASDFMKQYQGSVGGPQFRKALLDFQESRYLETPSKYQNAYVNRVNKLRSILPGA